MKDVLQRLAEKIESMEDRELANSLLEDLAQLSEDGHICTKRSRHIRYESDGVIVGIYEKCIECDSEVDILGRADITELSTEMLSQATKSMLNNYTATNGYMAISGSASYNYPISSPWTPVSTNSSFYTVSTDTHYTV